MKPTASDLSTTSLLRRLLLSAGAGAVTGLLGLGLDVPLAGWTLGYGMPLQPSHWLAYALTGALLGAVFGGVFRVGFAAERRSVLPALAALLPWCFFLLWTPAVAERVAYLLRLTEPWAVGAVAAAGVVVFGAIGWLIARLVPNARAVALLVLGVSMSMGLAIHRNVLDSDFSARALKLDGLVVLGALALFAASRWRPAERLGRAERRQGRALPTAVRALAVLVGVACWGVVVVDIRARIETPAVTERPTESPNLILFVADTLRWDIYQRVLEETPEGQAFAARLGDAAHFDRMTAIAPWTPPSVGSILTGLYPPDHGLGRLGLDPGRPLRGMHDNVPTLATRLGNRGYSTWAAIANPLLHPSTGIDRGFDNFRTLQPATTKLPLLTLYQQLEIVDAELYQSADSVTDWLTSTLGDLERTRPFFLWLHYMDPHAPYRGHGDLTPQISDLAQRDDAAIVYPGGVREDDTLYYGEVRFVLESMTRAIDALDRRGLWDNSAFVFVSDHGEMFESDARDTGSVSSTGEERDTGHGNALYDELVRVPLVVRPPGGVDGGVRFADLLVNHVDLYPTIVDLLAVDMPAVDSDGHSVAPWLTNAATESPTRRWSPTGFLQHQPPQRGLISGRNKIIDVEGPRLEIYDLEADPGERSDLSTQDQDLRSAGVELLERVWGDIGESEVDEDDQPPPEMDEETRRRLEALGYL